MKLNRMKLDKRGFVRNVLALAGMVLLASCATKEGMTKAEYGEMVKQMIESRDYSIWIDLNIYNGRRNGPMTNGIVLSTALYLQVKGDTVVSSLPPDFFVLGREILETPVVTGKIEHYKWTELSGGRIEVEFSFVPKELGTGKEMKIQEEGVVALSYRLVFGPWDYVGAYLHGKFFNGELYREKHLDAQISTLGKEEMLEFLKNNGFMKE